LKADRRRQILPQSCQPTKKLLFLVHESRCGKNCSLFFQRRNLDLDILEHLSSYNGHVHALTRISAEVSANRFLVQVPGQVLGKNSTFFRAEHKEVSSRERRTSYRPKCIGEIPRALRQEENVTGLQENVRRSFGGPNLDHVTEPNGLTRFVEVAYLKESVGAV